jgi:hypothetical protein
VIDLTCGGAANLVGKGGNYGNGFPVGRAELQLIAFMIAMHHDYGGDVPGGEAMFGHITCKNDPVKFVYHLNAFRLPFYTESGRRDKGCAVIIRGGDPGG